MPQTLVVGVPHPHAPLGQALLGAAPPPLAHGLRTASACTALRWRRRVSSSHSTRPTTPASHLPKICKPVEAREQHDATSPTCEPDQNWVARPAPVLKRIDPAQRRRDKASLWRVPAAKGARWHANTRAHIHPRPSTHARRPATRRRRPSWGSPPCTRTRWSSSSFSRRRGARACRRPSWWAPCRCYPAAPGRWGAPVPCCVRDKIGCRRSRRRNTRHRRTAVMPPSAPGIPRLALVPPRHARACPRLPTVATRGLERVPGG